MITKIWCEKCCAQHEPGDHFGMFEIWCLDWGGPDDMPFRVRALDPEQAAERWADGADAENYQQLMDGVTLAIQPEGDPASRVKVELHGEATIDWYADEVGPMRGEGEEAGGG